MEYEKLNREELINLLKKKEDHIEELQSQLSELEAFKFPWAGNLGHWYWDFKENKVTFNELKALTLGYTKEELPEKVGFEFFTDKLHPDDYERVMQSMRDHLEGRSPAYEVEYRIHTKEGGYKWYYDRGTILSRDIEGKPEYLAGIVFDISEQKQIEENLKSLNEQLNKELSNKNKFFSILSHDLRGPLSTINELISFIISRYDQYDSKKIYEFILNMHQSLGSIAELTENLFLWSRIQKEDIEFQPEELNPEDVIANNINLLKEQAEKKNVSIDNKNGIHQIILTDKMMLNFIIRNLLSNAIKFSFPNGKIVITAREENDHALISIKDNGPGIPEETIPKLFTPENKITTEGTSGEKGSGLGLVLCKEFANKSGGDIKVKSEKGKGSTFTIMLPL